MITNDPLRRWIDLTVARHPAVESVHLAGSRAHGTPTRWSDWDFVVATKDFSRIRDDLPALSRELQPLAVQWDRLSPHECWMLMLVGPVKVDLIFPDQPRRLEPPWRPAKRNIAALDAHFWDWALWLRSKEAAGKTDLVTEELAKLFDHILAPLGVASSPTSARGAVHAYMGARAELQERRGWKWPADLEAAVAPAILGDNLEG